MGTMAVAATNHAPGPLNARSNFEGFRWPTLAAAAALAAATATASALPRPLAAGATPRRALGGRAGGQDADREPARAPDQGRPGSATRQRSWASWPSRFRPIMTNSIWSTGPVTMDIDQNPRGDGERSARSSWAPVPATRAPRHGRRGRGGRWWPGSSPIAQWLIAGAFIVAVRVLAASTGCRHRPLGRAAIGVGSIGGLRLRRPGGPGAELRHHGPGVGVTLHARPAPLAVSGVPAQAMSHQPVAALLLHHRLALPDHRPGRVLAVLRPVPAHDDRVRLPHAASLGSSQQFPGLAGPGHRGGARAASAVALASPTKRQRADGAGAAASARARQAPAGQAVAPRHAAGHGGAPITSPRDRLNLAVITADRMLAFMLLSLALVTVPPGAKAAPARTVAPGSPWPSPATLEFHGLARGAGHGRLAGLPDGARAMSVLRQALVLAALRLIVLAPAVLVKPRGRGPGPTACCPLGLTMSGPGPSLYPAHARLPRRCRARRVGRPVRRRPAWPWHSRC